MEKYEAMEMEVIFFDMENVITTSGENTRPIDITGGGQ